MLKLSKYLRFNATTQKFFNRIFIFTIFMVLGMMGMSQYSLYKKLGFVKSLSDPSGSALRISKMYTTNEDLKKQISELTLKRDELNSSAVGSKELEQILLNEKEKYLLLSGATEVIGPGVLIKINHFLVPSQLIDFINAIKNISAEAISINGERLTPTTSISHFANQSSYTIQVVGNKDALYESITRSGGAFDLIVNGQAEKMDELILPKAKL